MESKKRTIIKAMSYRSLVTAILAALSWTFTSNADQITIITVTYAILATVGYYRHVKGYGIELFGRRKNQVLNIRQQVLDSY
jgi:uncharacterized membrane protein